jgi:hypothetical protein
MPINIIQSLNIALQVKKYISLNLKIYKINIYAYIKRNNILFLFLANLIRVKVF